MSEIVAGDLRNVPDWRRPAIIGYVIILMAFVGVGGWSFFAKMDSAVVASGAVDMESHRKTVQHLEDGILSRILVREGQHVEEDQVLFRLDSMQSRSAFDLQQNQLDAALAQEARLLAEREGHEGVVFPQELQENSEKPTVARAMLDQVKDFKERKASLAGQIDILQSRIEQYKTEIAGHNAEQDATDRQLQFIVEELNDLRYLLDRNLVPKSRVLALEREKSRLEGVVGRSIADRAKAENGIGEAQLQMRQLRQKSLEEVSGLMLEVRQKIGDLREKVRVAADVLHRIDVVAPVSGTVQGLRVFTQGGVIKAGEPLLDIVPDHGPLIVQAHVMPHDMEGLIPGMSAEVRFPSFRASVLPLMLGHVESVSRDRLIDDSTKQPYFLAQVVVEDIPDTVRERLTAGMPADLVFPTGERTVLDYIVRPLKDRMRSALREK